VEEAREGGGSAVDSVEAAEIAMDGCAADGGDSKQLGGAGGGRAEGGEEERILQMLYNGIHSVNHLSGGLYGGIGIQR
jgi:hypothetical protein